MASTVAPVFQPSKVYAWIQVGEVATDFNDSVTSMTVLNTIFDGESDSVGHRLVNGMDVLIGTEILKVSGISSSTDTGITIARAELNNSLIADRAADRGAAAASHDDGDAIYAWSELNDQNGLSLLQHLSLEDTIYQPQTLQLILRNTTRNSIYSDAGIIDGVIRENTPLKVIDQSNFSVLFRGDVSTISKQHDNNGSVLLVTAYDALYQLGRSRITGEGSEVYYSAEAGSEYSGALATTAADVSDKNISSLIKKLVQNYQPDIGDGTDGAETQITTAEPISNSSNAEARFRTSNTPKTASAINGRINFASTQDSVLHSLQRLALTDNNPDLNAFGYTFFVDANHYSPSTGLKTVPLLNYGATSYLPGKQADEGGGAGTGEIRFENVSSTAAVTEKGSVRRIVQGASFDEVGSENVNIINVRYRDGQTGQMREIEMEAFYVGTGGAIAGSGGQFYDSYNPTGADKRIHASAGDPAGLRGAHDNRVHYDSATAKSESSFPSRVVDANDDIIGYVQYAGFASNTSGLLVLSGTTNTTADGNRATVSAGQTIYLNTASSGNNKVLSAVTDPTKANTFRPAVATGKRVAITMEFGADYSASNIREAVAARFLSANNPKVRGRFQVTGAYPAIQFQSQVASSGDTITETTVGSRTLVQYTDANISSGITDSGNNVTVGGYNDLVKAGSSIMKLDGDGGNVSEHGYVNYVRKNNTSSQENLRFMLNSGSISANDYLRFACPIKAGYVVTVDSKMHGIAARPHLITSMIYNETAGKSYTDIESIGFRDGTINNDGTLNLQKAIVARKPNTNNIDDMTDDDYGGTYTFTNYKPHWRGQFYPGHNTSGTDSSGSVSDKHNNVSWNAGTLYVGNETFAINNGNSRHATYGLNGSMVATDGDNDGNPNTHYIVFFDPHVKVDEFLVLEEAKYEQRNSNIGRSATAGNTDLYPIGSENVKIARIAASPSPATAKIELFVSQGASTASETSNTASTIVYSSGRLGGSQLSGDVANSWVPSVNNTHDLGTSTLAWKDINYEGNITDTSDARVKDNIEPLELGLDFVNELEPVQYNKKSNPTKLDVGVTAQDVLDAIEKAGLNPKKGTIVHEIETDNNMRLNYLKLIAPILKAIQELSDKVDKLENEGKE
tara:strand:- start:1326 stop:4730 length:3405 start_codon:yes stop_codon:yes gene_type:complete